MAPAVEQGEDGKEEEHVSPLHQEVVGIEGAEEQRGHQAEDKEVECEPGDEEQLPPVAKTVTREAGKFITDIKILFTYKYYSNIPNTHGCRIISWFRSLSWKEINCRVEFKQIYQR